jgi:hypothetical protein
MKTVSNKYTKHRKYFNVDLSLKDACDIAEIISRSHEWKSPKDICCRTVNYIQRKLKKSKQINYNSFITENELAVRIRDGAGFHVVENEYDTFKKVRSSLAAYCKKCD